VSSYAVTRFLSCLHPAILRLEEVTRRDRAFPVAPDGLVNVLPFWVLVHASNFIVTNAPIRLGGVRATEADRAPGRCLHLLVTPEFVHTLLRSAFPDGGPLLLPRLPRCAKCRPNALLTEQTGSRSGRNPSAVLREYITWVYCHSYTPSCTLTVPTRTLHNPHS
jgi:hypothetical protein